MRLNKRLNIGEQAQYLLLSNEGRTLPEIARYLSRNGHTISLWIQCYMADGLRGVMEQPTHLICITE
jgi:transposase-like protein